MIAQERKTDPNLDDSFESFWATLEDPDSSHKETARAIHDAIVERIDVYLAEQTQGLLNESRHETIHELRQLRKNVFSDEWLRCC